MNTSNWFDDQPVIGKLPPEQAAAKLREVGENEAADMLEVAQDTQSKSFFESRGRKSWWPFQDKPWQHTSHAFGYLAPSLPGSDPQPIYSISNITPDPTLKNTQSRDTCKTRTEGKRVKRGIADISVSYSALR